MTTIQGILAVEIKVVDEKFSLEKLENYHLSIQLAKDAFSFTVLDKISNQYLLLEKYSLKGFIDWEDICLQINETVLSHKILNHLRVLNSGSVALVYPKSTLVPRPFYSKEQEAQFLTVNHKAEDDDVIYSDQIMGFNAYNVYYVPEQVEHAFKKLFPKIKLMHYASPLLESLAGKFSNSTQKKVIVHIQSGAFDVIVIKGKELLFYNNFSYVTAEDFMYHLLFCCEQLKLSPEELDLLISGEIDRTSTLFNLIKKYIRNVGFINRPEAYGFSYKMDELPGHYYYNLFNQYLCV